MLRYIIKRLLLLIPVLLGVITIVFAITLLTPGDPVDLIVGADASEEVREATREEWGLNDPVIVRYVKYIYNIVTKLDFGNSYTNGQPIRDELLRRFPVTVKLAFISVALGVVIAVPLGVLSAIKQYTWVDSSILVITIITVSMPNFWLALMMMLLFAVQLGWLPSTGIETAAGWIMPVICVAIGTMSSITRMTRSSMLEVMRQDYIRTARAKGQKEGVVITKHMLRNALIPVITAIGNSLGVHLGGSVTIEAVFGLPGIGQYIVNAISSRNYPAIQGGVILLAAVFTVINLLVDIAYTAVDPRMKSEFAAKAKPKKKIKVEVTANG